LWQKSFGDANNPLPAGHRGLGLSAELGRCRKARTARGPERARGVAILDPVGASGRRGAGRPLSRPGRQEGRVVLFVAFPSPAQARPAWRQLQPGVAGLRRGAGHFARRQGALAVGGEAGRQASARGRRRGFAQGQPGCRSACADGSIQLGFIARVAAHTCLDWADRPDHRGTTGRLAKPGRPSRHLGRHRTWPSTTRPWRSRRARGFPGRAPMRSPL